MPTTNAAKDAALASVTTSSIKWIVLLTGTPATSTAAGVHAVRFTGSAPVSVATNAWSSPTGSAVRQVSNASTLTFATATGLNGATTVTGFAIVSTSDDAVPAAGSTFSNVDAVWFHGPLASNLSVSNNDTPRFTNGTLVVEATGT